MNGLGLFNPVANIFILVIKKISSIFLDGYKLLKGLTIRRVVEFKELNVYRDVNLEINSCINYRHDKFRCTYNK